MATNTVGEAPVQRGQDPDHRELRGARRREGEALEDRPVAVARLRGHRADERVDEGLVPGRSACAPV